jgi:large subunit ribosomal protein L23
MKDLYAVLKRPLVTEKTTTAAENQNMVAFVVDPRATKQEIRQAVETVFKVTVLNVATMNLRGKVKRMGRFQGKRPNWKKALVQLKAGDSIEFFQGM